MSVCDYKASRLPVQRLEGHPILEDLGGGLRHRSRVRRSRSEPRATRVAKKRRAARTAKKKKATKKRGAKKRNKKR
jgi:hypothetical protein